MQEWLEVFYKHFELIDDSPSTIPNPPEFRENRHDQSVWSVLNKKYKVKNYPYRKWFDQSYSVLYNRNKIYLPASVEQTKALNEAVRGAGRYSFQWNLQVYQRSLEEYANSSAMILNSKSFLGYIRMPYVLSYIKEAHKKEIADYEAKAAKNPKLKLPKLESYADYKEALKEKECFTYKLGLALMEADKTWYKGGYLRFFFQEIPKLRRALKEKRK